ncbi:MAG: nucleotidyl transferase AbiEii/AbiGii toxin family protein [Deltaproteobacteria bacterium]|nr:nucleotidyl transferase AbiEii/AbiGii toxin family protein [Deltaproteobacteria bacterium]
MKDIILKNISNQKNPVKRENALREELQHLVLKILDDGGFFKNISFVGGTALRVLFGLRRFSEDMDFSLQIANNPVFKFQEMLRYVVDQLTTYKFQIDIKTKQKGAVQSVFLRFKEVLQEFDIVKIRGQKLSIKLEIDTNPPPFARFETRLLQKDFMFTVVHHDLPTLLAGKTLAFLNRAYTKGRDLYDMIWFLTKNVKMNEEFFKAGLQQQNPDSEKTWTRDELRKNLTVKLDGMDMPLVIEDVRPFLDNETEVRFFDALLIKPLFEKIEFEKK